MRDLGTYKFDIHNKGVAKWRGFHLATVEKAFFESAISEFHESQVASKELGIRKTAFNELRLLKV
jgi:hypothetical protein